MPKRGGDHLLGSGPWSQELTKVVDDARTLDSIRIWRAPQRLDLSHGAGHRG